MQRSKKIQKSNNFKDNIKSKVETSFKFDLNSYRPTAQPEITPNNPRITIQVKKCGSFNLKEKSQEIISNLKLGKEIHIEGKGKLSEKAVNLLEIVKSEARLLREDYVINLLEGSEAGLAITIRP